MSKTHRTQHELALAMLPVMVRWAQESPYKQHYYSDLSRAVNHGSNQIGGVLGEVDTILKDLQKKTGREIPPINAIVVSKQGRLPSNGLSIVFSAYDDMSKENRKEFYLDMCRVVHEFDWNWVLDELGLERATIFDDEELEQHLSKIRNSHAHGNGHGEGAEHKRLKNYVLENPNDLGIRNVVSREPEHLLLSGDLIDVFFVLRNGTMVGVEVKSHISDDSDILRGIFQCVKYKAVLEAMRATNYGIDGDYRKHDVQVMLVVERPLSEKNAQVANDLGIDVRVL